MIAAVIALALNLRPAVNSIGAVIPQMRIQTGLSGAAAGVLLALPTLCFAVLGLSAAGVAGRVGTHRTVVYAVAAMIAGQLARSLGSGLPWLFAGSVLALAGVAMGNVLLPGLVRLHFPNRIAAMTAVYTTMLSAGGAVAAGVTLPVEQALQGSRVAGLFDSDWQLGIGIWAGAAVLALIPWLPLGAGRHPPKAHAASAVIGLRRLARTRLAWVMVGYFGTQALQAYVMFGWLPEILTGAGISITAAAFHVSVLAVIGVVIAAAVPALLARLRVVVLVVFMAGCYLAGYLVLIVDPGGLSWVACGLVGIGTGAFPVALTLVGLRARTAGGTIGLSALTQSLGYLLASVGPFLFGLLHDLLGGWTGSLLMLVALVFVHLAFGLAAARTRYIEDELGPPAAGAGQAG